MLNTRDNNKLTRHRLTQADLFLNRIVCQLASPGFPVVAVAILAGSMISGGGIFVVPDCFL